MEDEIRTTENEQVSEEQENENVQETAKDEQDGSAAVVAADTGAALAADGAPSYISVEAYSWFDTILHAFLIIVVVFVLFTRMSTVDGDSMLPTLVDQQRLMISDFLYKPAYNDIVVIWADKLPNDDDGYGKAIVKRVIGVEGDTIHIDYQNGRLYRNGELLPQEMKDGVLWEDGHMLNTYTNREEGLGGDFIVPEGCAFVMGDNRNNSTDSRSPFIGFVDTRCIMGRAYARVWPLNKFGGIYG